MEVFKSEFLTPSTEEFAYIAEKRNKLKHLGLRYCLTLSDTHISLIIQHCPLEVLDVTGCPNIRGNFIFEPNQIHTIYLDHCSGLDIKEYHYGKKTQLHTISYDNYTSHKNINIIIKSTDSLENIVVTKAAVDFSYIQEIKTLKVLNVIGRSFGYHETTAFEHCTVKLSDQLRELTMDKCQKSTHWGNYC